MTLSTERRPALAQLRELASEHYGGPASARRLAEQQAAMLRRLLAKPGPSDPTTVAFRHALPNVRILLADIPTSGLSVLDGKQWIIAVDRSEPSTRRRFTILHEYKHIINHPHVDWLYYDRRGVSATHQAEEAADYFAGCVLVPSRELRRLWSKGVRDVGHLAATFDVSAPAIRVRLAQLRLVARSATAEPESAPRSLQTTGARAS